jgi:KDO2-lipid IV(A) lauroyltransferase
MNETAAAGEGAPPVVPAPAAGAEERLSGLGGLPAAAKRRPLGPVRLRAEYAVARLILLTFRHLPGGLARALAHALAELGWRLLPGKRREMLRHMDLAFRDGTPREKKLAWARANFHHLALMVVEFCRMHHLRKENLAELCDMTQLQVIFDLLKKGRGIIGVPGHIGNWELLGYAAALLGAPMRPIVRPLDNPLVNDLVDEVRETSGIQMIRKWQALWKLKRVLAENNVISLAIDQNGGNTGIFVPLFGVLASTIPSPAVMHFNTRAPIVVATLNRLPDGVRHRFHVWDVIEDFPRTGNPKADRYAVIRRINQALEKAILAFPDQWLWGHRRWKTRPEGEMPGPDGLPPPAPAAILSAPGGSEPPSSGENDE